MAEVGYLPAFRLATGVKLVAVADVNQARCNQLAPEVPAYKKISEIIEAGGLNALIISTPTRFHVEGARRAERT